MQSRTGSEQNVYEINVQIQSVRLLKLLRLTRYRNSTGFYIPSQRICKRENWRNAIRRQSKIKKSTRKMFRAPEDLK
jgi:hypothetical protein